MNYLIVFVLTFVLSLLLSLFVKRIARMLSIVDKPDMDRKKHKGEIPLLGGVAIFISFFTVLFVFRDLLVDGDLGFNHWIGFFLGALVLIAGGVIDDKYNLSPSRQIVFPLLAIFIVLISGINIEKITNPLASGHIYLDQLKIPMYMFSGEMVYFVVYSSILIALWLLGMMYTTKLLDGLDGLVTGVTMIGSFVIFLFTTSEKYYQGDIAFASLVLAGACLGFLVFNWHPAGIFLGEGGSLFLGFALGVLAIISGGKIAVALLVMGIPILDVAWTIFRRLRQGKNPFKFSDREHLHFRLLDLGLGHRTTVTLYYLAAIVFGLSALFLQSRGKIMALAILLIIMLMTVITLNKKRNKPLKQ